MGGGAEPDIIATEPAAAEAVVLESSAPPAAETQAAPADNEPTVEETGGAAAGDTLGVEPWTASVTVDGETMTFDLVGCGGWDGPIPGFSATGIAGAGAPAGAEFSVSQRDPDPVFDNETTEYDNSVQFRLANNTYRAGTLENPSIGEGGEWGVFDWTRVSGDIMSGTATLEQSYGADTPGPQQISFIVRCN